MFALQLKGHVQPFKTAQVCIAAKDAQYEIQNPKADERAGSTCPLPVIGTHLSKVQQCANQQSKRTEGIFIALSKNENLKAKQHRFALLLKMLSAIFAVQGPCSALENSTGLHCCSRAMSSPSKQHRFAMQLKMLSTRSRIPRQIKELTARALCQSLERICQKCSNAPISKVTGQKAYSMAMSSPYKTAQVCKTA
jgi:hypothetical protein